MYLNSTLLYPNILLIILVDFVWMFKAKFLHIAL